MKAWYNSEVFVVVPVMNEIGSISEFLSRLIPMLEARTKSRKVILSVESSKGCTIECFASEHLANMNMVTK